jgi:serine/threonine protein kinase
MRISEIPHVNHGRIAVCSCHATFCIDDSTVTEEFSLPDLPPPESIGRYSIVRYLGRGAMNCVYEGIHPELGIPVAVKTLLPEYTADRPSREQFLHAAKIYAKVVHPNIVKVYETGRDANGIPFLAMEFLSGGSLADRLLHTRNFPARETAEIGAEICRALVETAAHGIVHRDIKPDNIMLSADGKYKLTDLELAKLNPSTISENGACILDENDPVKLSRQTSFGTLEYMSPEQYLDTESCDIRSDIYSLGVTMYQLAAGRLPFETQTRSELRHMHISVEPLVPSSYAQDIPIDFDYIVMHCIQKRPEDRYHTPEELLKDLEAFLADAPLPSTTCGAVPFIRPLIQERKETGDHFALLPVVMIVFILLILAGAGLLFLMERSSAEQRKQLIAPEEPAESGEEATIFIGPPAAGSPVSYAIQSKKMLDENVDNGDEKANSLSFDPELFAKTRDKAKEALDRKTGFRKAIDDLKAFEPYEECEEEVRTLTSELEKESQAAVDRLMRSLNEKAHQLIEKGNYDGAINVYDIDAEIEPLKQESMEARNEAKRLIGEMRPDTAKESAAPEPIEYDYTGEGPRP